MKVLFTFEFHTFSKEKQIELLENIENLPCLPILAEEVFFYSYPEIISCSNP